MYWMLCVHGGLQIGARSGAASYKPAYRLIQMVLT
jgi:hypothetical protein